MRGKRWAVCGALALSFSALILDSRFRLQPASFELSFESLPPAFDGFRVLVLSDLHGYRFGRGQRRLIRAVKALRPDLIALTGDFVGRRAHLEALRELLTGLDGLAPMAFVTGNHEWVSGLQEETKKLCRARGVRILDDRWDALERDGQRILLAGAEDPKGGGRGPEALTQALRREAPEDFVLLLGHRNQWVKRYPRLPVQLILCGHAHGGILRLPLLGGLLNNDHSLGAEYDAGLYRSGTYVMAVSRGLGNSVSIPRFLNRPEILCLTLRSGQA